MNARAASLPALRGSAVAAIALGVFLVLAAVRFDSFFRAPVLEEGDVAVNAIQIHHAKSFSELYGNYSRFEFHHPGPAFFYVYAAFEWLLHDVLAVTPSPHHAHLFACLALQVLFFALALGLLHTLRPHLATIPLALVAIALLFSRIPGAFVSLWSPHVLLLPFLCFLTATTSVATGRLEHLPWAMLAAGFLFHGHVAQPLFIATLGGVGLWLGVRHAAVDRDASWREALRHHRRRLVFAFVLGVGFLLPLVLDVILHGGRSNVAMIVGRFTAITGEGNSVFQSLLYFLSFATPGQEQEKLLDPLGPQTTAFFLAHAPRIAAWILVFALPFAIAFARRRRLGPAGRRFFFAAGAVLATSVVACLLWGMAQAGGMYYFNGHFYHAIYAFAALIALAPLAGLAERFHPRFVSGILIAAAALLFGRFERPPPASEADRGLPIQRSVAAALAVDPSPASKLLVFEHGDWPTAASVALELRRRGFDFHVDPWWTFMFEPRHSVTRLGDPPERDAAVWWIVTNTAGGLPLTDRLTLHVQPAPLSPEGGEIRFGEPGRGFRYIVTGFNVSRSDRVTTSSDRAVLRFAPGHTDRDVRLVFDASAFNADGAARPADLVFNGQPIGRVTVDARAEVGVTVPAALWNSRPAATLELRFPNSIWRRARARPDYEWCWNWALWKIRCDS